MCITFTESISVWIPLSSTFMVEIFNSGVKNGGWIWTACLFPSFLVYLPVKKEAKNENAKFYSMTRAEMDWMLDSDMRTVLYLGVIGLHRTNSTLLQKPRVKGFAPPWNFLVT